VLETLRAPLTRDQELRVARAAATAGVPARAIRGFSSPRRPPRRRSRQSDRLAYAGALARGGRRAEAISLYEQIERDGGELAGVAAYQRARALLQSGSGAAARSALRSVASRYGSVGNVSAAAALLLLADLQVDDNDLAGAARSLAELTRLYPTAEQAPLARFHGGLLGLRRAATASRSDVRFARRTASDDEEAAGARGTGRRARSSARAGVPMRWRDGARSRRSRRSRTTAW
jgi:hypothetical protein